MLSLQSARHIALFVAASTPAFIDQLAMAMPRIRAGVRRVRRTSATAKRRVRAQPPLLFPRHGVGARPRRARRVALAWLIPKMQVQAYSLAYAQEFPVCAAQWLKGAPEPLKIFNQYGEGGYLSYELSSRGDKVLHLR